MQLVRKYKEWDLYWTYFRVSKVAQHVFVDLWQMGGQRCVKIVHVSENENKVKFSHTFFMNVKSELSSSRWKRPATNEKSEKQGAVIS